MEKAEVRPKVNKEEILVNNIEEDKIFLSDNDRRELEILFGQRENVNLKLVILNKKLENCNLAISKNELENKILKIEQSSIIQNLKSDREKVRKKELEYQDLIKKITEKYSLKNGWGFDPETGEIDNGEK